DCAHKPAGATTLPSLARNNPPAASTRAPAARSTPAPAGAQATPAAPGQSMVAAQPSATLSPTAAVTPAQTPAAQPTAAQTAAPSASSSPADISLRSLTLTNGTIRVTDKSVAPPAALVLGSLKAGLENLRTAGQNAPATFNLGTTLGGGGTIGVKGALDLAHSTRLTHI